MPFRATFDCLWCGRRHETRSGSDLEGWAQLCSDCLGRAGENGFLRARLRAALEERAAGPTRPEAFSRDRDREMVEYYDARADEYDDWYLRRGKYAHGPLDDMAWQTDLDTATLWLDALPWTGQIVELAAGTGWWSPLLAGKGELWAYDAASKPLDRARTRLLAHGLRAHLHVRDAWEEPDRRVDGVFAGFWLSHIPRSRLDSFLALVRRWLKPGGLFAFVDSRADPKSGAGETSRVADEEVDIRRLADGRTFRIPKVFFEAAELEAALARAGFRDVEVQATPRFFVLGRGLAA